MALSQKFLLLLNKANLFILDSAHYGDQKISFLCRNKINLFKNELDINKLKRMLKMKWSIRS